MWLPHISLHVHARSGVLGIRVLTNSGKKPSCAGQRGSVEVGNRGSLKTGGPAADFVPVRSVRARRFGAMGKREQAYLVVVANSDLPPNVARQRRKLGALLLQPASAEITWRNEQLTLFALAWAANNIILLVGVLYLLYGLLSVLDDAQQMGDAANAAFFSHILTTYLRSAAVGLCGKDVIIPLIVTALPRQEDLRSERMRKLVAKLGGTHYHEHR